MSMPHFLRYAFSASLEILHRLEAGYIATRVTVDWVNSELFYVAKSALNSRVRHALWVESNQCIIVFNKAEPVHTDCKVSFIFKKINLSFVHYFFICLSLGE